MRRLLPSSIVRANVAVRCLAAPALGIILVAGCGGGSSDVDMTVRKPASQRPDVDQGGAASGSLSIPATREFNITSFKSGQTGAARGTSDPVAGSGADCRAEARDGGSAWGEFQLGYCFDNTSRQLLSAAVKVRLSVAESSASGQADGPAADRAVAQAGGAAGVQSPATTQGTGDRPDGGSTIPSTNLLLKFFIKDTNGLVLKEQSLVSASSEKGPHSANGVREVVFDARFEPDRGYYLVIAGRADAQAASGQSAQAALSVTQCAMEIVWEGAAPPAAEK
jgi:hypothetical protein